MAKITKIEKDARDAFERWKKIHNSGDWDHDNAMSRIYDIGRYRGILADYIEQDSDFAFLNGDRELICVIVKTALSIMAVPRVSGDGSFDAFSKIALVQANNLRNLPLFWRTEAEFYGEE